MNRSTFVLIRACFVLAVGALFPPSVFAQERQPRFRGVVVGISNYEGALALKAKLDEGAAKAKTALELYARRAGYSDIEVILMVDRDPVNKKPRPNVSPSDIYRLLHDKSIQAHDPRDTLVFYFTGHGARLAGKMQLYASGAREGDDSDYVALERIVEKVQMSGASTKMLFIDACQVLIDPTAMAEPKATYGSLQTDTLRPQGIAIFYASSRGDPALIDFNVGYGYFTKHLIGVLNRDDEKGLSPTGLRYASQLHEYLLKAVSPDVADREKRKQSPYASLEGALVFDLMPLLSPKGGGIVPAQMTVPSDKRSPSPPPPRTIPSRPGCTEITDVTVEKGVETWSKKCV